MTVDIEAIRSRAHRSVTVGDMADVVKDVDALLDEVERYKGVLEHIAAHNGDRWIYEDGYAEMRQDTPQEIAKEALGDE